MKTMNASERLMYMKKFIDYLNKYGDCYSELSLEFLLNQFLYPIPTEHIPDILKQIYAALDMLEPLENCYLQFAKIVGQRYGWDSHILEIGGGFFPMFSKYVDDFQTDKGSSGTITTYDPSLVVSKLGNIKLHKSRFEESMAVSSYDLIVGIMPCEATELIIKKATLEHKEFFVAMCGCIHRKDVPHSAKYVSASVYNRYVEDVYQLAKEQEKDGFIVTKESAMQYSFRYPVISSKKVK